METYSECDVCGKWDDLIMWKNANQMTIAFACNDCYNRLDSLSIRGYTRTIALETVRREIQNGKK